MAVLIFLIIVDLIMIGVVMYFVMVEKTPSREAHHGETVSEPSAAATPIDTPAETPREWAVQTVSDSEVNTAPAATAEEGTDTLVAAPEEPVPQTTESDQNPVP